jgi:hypothetical protein
MKFLLSRKQTESFMNYLLFIFEDDCLFIVMEYMNKDVITPHYLLLMGRLEFCNKG